MPKRDLTKLRVLHLARLLEQETDERHALTLTELSERLEALGLGAERKALYRDLDALRESDWTSLRRSPAARRGTSSARARLSSRS